MIFIALKFPTKNKKGLPTKIIYKPPIKITYILP